MRDPAAAENLKLFSAVAALVLLMSAGGCESPRPSFDPVVPFTAKARFLDDLPDSVELGDLTFSPDGLEVSYPWKASNGREGFAINGRIERYYDRLGDYLAYSRDGTHYAYVAEKGGKQAVVFDGTAGPFFDKVAEPDLPATGKAYAYAAKSGDDVFIIFNERQSGKKDYDLIAPPDVSPDGKHLAYRAQKGELWRYVIDEVEGPLFDAVDDGHFSPDSLSFAYAAKRGGKWFFVRDGKESPPYDAVGVFPESARDDVYTAQENGKSFVVFHEKRGSDYDDVGWPTVSPGGKKVAYAAKKGGKDLVVVDGSEGKPYDMVGRPAFSPNGRQVAYDAVDGKTFLMVRGRKELRDYAAMPTPTYGPDGGFAYTAVTPDASRHFVVRDGVKGKEYDKVGLLVWSPDGKHLAHIAREGKRGFVVIDGREGVSYDAILSAVPRFSPDGKFVGVNAMKGREVWWVVEDVVEEVGN